MRPILLRDRIVAALGKRLASKHAPDSQPKPAPGTVLSQGLLHVLAAAGLKSTNRRNDPRESQPIEPNGEQEDPFHQDGPARRLSFFMRVQKAAQTVACSVSPSADFGMNTKSKSPGTRSRFRRKTSLRSRFTRVRVTAPPTLLETLRPIRGWPRPLRRTETTRESQRRDLRLA